MSLLFYRWIHLSGVILVLLSIAPWLFHAGISGVKSENPWRKPMSIAHGVGMLLLLVGGFGLLARLGLTSSMPVWAIIKFVLWIALGGIFGMAYKLKNRTFALWVSVLLIAILAAYLGGQKPTFG